VVARFFRVKALRLAFPPLVNLLWKQLENELLQPRNSGLGKERIDARLQKVYIFDRPIDNELGSSHGNA